MFECDCFRAAHFTATAAGASRCICPWYVPLFQLGMHVSRTIDYDRRESFMRLLAHGGGNKIAIIAMRVLRVLIRAYYLHYAQNAS